jgi:hypothetical protein
MAMPEISALKMSSRAEKKRIGSAITTFAGVRDGHDED